jgi:hypothetical protein
MPAVHGGQPATRGLVEDPLRPAPADLVDAEHPYRIGLRGQHLGGVAGERRRYDRPRDVVVTGGLHDRTARVSHRRAGRRAQPYGQPLASRDRPDRLGERAAPTRRLVATPSSLTPHQFRPPATHGQIPWPDRAPSLRAPRLGAALRAAPGFLIGGEQMHHRPFGTVQHCGDSQAVQSQRPASSSIMPVALHL